jgi:hypothetical protein
MERRSTCTSVRQRSKEDGLGSFGHNRKTSLIPLDGDPLAARNRISS